MPKDWSYSAGLFHFPWLWLHISLSCDCFIQLGQAKGPLFIYQDGHPFLQAHLSSFLQSTLQTAGIPEKFSGRSFRILAATTASQWGIPDHLMKNMVLTLMDSILSVAEQIS